MKNLLLSIFDTLNASQKWGLILHEVLTSAFLFEQTELTIQAIISAPTNIRVM